MSRTISHDELRNNSTAILREVEAGGTLTVTNHGKVVALLVPPQSRTHPEPLRVRKAVTRESFSTLMGVMIDHPIQATLDELRGDR